MPTHAMEAALRSEKLQLKTENTTLTLALSWVHAQPGTEEERQQLFNRLLKSLRYARMSAFFLADAVTEPLVVASGMVPHIVRRGFSRREEFERGFNPRLPVARRRGGQGGVSRDIQGRG